MAKDESTENMADTTQRVSIENVDKVKKIGTMGDTFDSVLSRLIDEHYELEKLKSKK
jgi:hypothetical protein